VAAALTGYTEKAIRRKIEDGKWLEGREYIKAPDGHILISMKGYAQWAERGWVEVRERSIRLSFTFEASRSAAPSAERQAAGPHAGQHQARRPPGGRDQGQDPAGVFSMAEYFPDDGRHGGLTVAGQLERWLKAQRLESQHPRRLHRREVLEGPLIGDKPLKALVHSDILTALATRPDLSGKTVNNYVSVLREALELACWTR
jgi:integrase